MKCPNCGEEAINVNGKFVCLDCGIQIEPSDIVDTPTVTPQILNHSDDQNDLEAALPKQPEPTPIQPVSGEKVIERPVQNYYENTLAQASVATDGSFDFGSQLKTESENTSSPKATVPDFPGLTPNPQTTDIPVETVNNLTPPVTLPQEPTNPFNDIRVNSDEAAASEPKLSTAESNAGEVNTLPENPENTIIENTENNSLQSPEPVIVPDAPEDSAVLPNPVEQNNGQIPAAPVMPPVTETSVTPGPIETVAEQNNQQVPEVQFDQAVPEETQSVVAENETPVVMEEPKLEIAEPQSEAKAPETKMTPESNLPVESSTSRDEEITSNEIQVKSADSFFQPSKVEINQVKNEPPVTNPGNFTFDSFSSAATTTPVQEVEKLDQAGASEIQEKATTEVPPTKSLDELLSETAAPPVPAPAASIPSHTFDSLKPAAPMISAESKSGIPSVESVFGSSSNPVPATTPNKKSRKTLFLSIGIVVGFFILIGSVFGFISYQKKAAARRVLLLEQETLRLSDKISKAMEAPMDLTVTFQEKIDLSKVTIREDGKTKEELAALEKIKSSIENKGSWKSDKTGNTAIESNLEKKIYQNKENRTLAFTDKWVPQEGYAISTAPVLYDPQSRGGLFYLTRVERFIGQGGEQIDGETLTKIKIVPKKEMIQEIITVSNPTLVSTSFNSINVENLEIMAWVDKTNLLRKVTVSGDVGVESDLFSGTVSIDSQAEYSYQGVLIQAPVVYKQEAPVVQAVQRIEEKQNTRRIEIVDARG